MNDTNDSRRPIRVKDFGSIRSNIRDEHVVHGTPGMVSWHCWERLYAAYEGSFLVINEWWSTDEPVTCLRCMHVLLKGDLNDYD